MPSQQRSSVVGERVLVPRLVGNAQHPGRLVDDDDVAVGKHDRALGKRTGAKLGRLLVDDDHRARRNARRRVEAALAIDGDAAFGAQAARTRPRDARLLANDRRDGGLGRCHVDCAWRQPARCIADIRSFANSTKALTSREWILSLG